MSGFYGDGRHALERWRCCRIGRERRRRQAATRRNHASGDRLHGIAIAMICLLTPDARPSYYVSKS